MRALVIVALLPTIAAASPLHVRPSDLVGDWVAINEKVCPDNVSQFHADRTYGGHCAEMVEGGTWTLRGATLTITYYEDLIKKTFPKSPQRTQITLMSLLRRGPRTVLNVRYENGKVDKWVKQSGLR